MRPGQRVGAAREAESLRGPAESSPVPVRAAPRLPPSVRFGRGRPCFPLCLFSFFFFFPFYISHPPCSSLRVRFRRRRWDIGSLLGVMGGAEPVAERAPGGRPLPDLRRPLALCHTNSPRRGAERFAALSWCVERASCY